MIVLHILWAVLEIVGILLLILLGLLLLGILLVLFCPVVYQAEGKKDSHALYAAAGVSWLFHLVSFKIWYENQKMDYSVRIFGISLKKVMEFFSRRQEKREKIKSQKKAELTVTEKKTPEKSTVLSGEQSVSEAVKVPDKTEKDSKETVKAETPGKAKHKIKFRNPFAVMKKIMGIPGKIINAVKNFRLTVKKIHGKIEKIKGILKSEQFLKGKSLIFREVKKLFRHILPKKAEGYIRFGTEDPCTTGEILAAAGIFYPLYGEYLTIEPYFDQKILEGNLFIRGRIQGIFFVLPAWKLFWDSNIRYIVKKFKQL